MYLIRRRNAIISILSGKLFYLLKMPAYFLKIPAIGSPVFGVLSFNLFKYAGKMSLNCFSPSKIPSSLCANCSSLCGSSVMTIHFDFSCHCQNRDEHVTGFPNVVISCSPGCPVVKVNGNRIFFPDVG